MTPNDKSSALGIALTEARKKRGFTQHEVAEKIHTHRVSVSRWESGAVTPSLEAIIAVAWALKTTVGGILRRARQIETERESES
jgi:transcriptional regulator with XRE-family HTH domain